MANNLASAVCLLLRVAFVLILQLSRHDLSSLSVMLLSVCEPPQTCFAQWELSALTAVQPKQYVRFSISKRKMCLFNSLL